MDLCALLRRSGLAVTRHPRESVVLHVDGEVVAAVEVIDIDYRRNRVRLRVVAPPSIRIDRDEIYRRNLTAASAGGAHG